MESLYRYMRVNFGSSIKKLDGGCYSNIRYDEDRRAWIEEVWSAWPRRLGSTLLSDRVAKYLPPNLEIRRFESQIDPVLGMIQSQATWMIGTSEELDKAGQVLRKIMDLMRDEMPKIKWVDE